jgi:hypothetical protein
MSWFDCRLSKSTCALLMSPSLPFQSATAERLSKCAIQLCFESQNVRDVEYESILVRPKAYISRGMICCSEVCVFQSSNFALYTGISKRERCHMSQNAILNEICVHCPRPGMNTDPRTAKVFFLHTSDVFLKIQKPDTHDE